MPKKERDSTLIYWIKVLYILFSIIWLFIIFYFSLYDIGVLACFLMFIPFIVFATGFLYANIITENQETGVFEASFLAIGLLVVVPLINWMKDNYKGDCMRFVTLILFSIGLTLMSVLDIWLPENLMRLNKHFRLCFETMAVTMFLIILYMYYVGCDGQSMCNTTCKLKNNSSGESNELFYYNRD